MIINSLKNISSVPQLIVIKVIRNAVRLGKAFIEVCVVGSSSANSLGLYVRVFMYHTNEWKDIPFS